jgi:hypothetical protein
MSERIITLVYGFSLVAETDNVMFVVPNRLHPHVADNVMFVVPNRLHPHVADNSGLWYC